MDAELVKVVCSIIPTTIVAVATLISSLRNKRRIDKLHLTINGRLNQLLEETRRSAHAEGYSAGKQSVCHARKD